MGYDEHLELVENARDALGALLETYAPHEGMYFRNVYGVLSDVADGVANRSSAERHAAPCFSHFEETGDDDRNWRECQRRRAMWKAMPWEQRENLLLHALGEDRLTKREIAERLNEQMGGNVGVYTVIRERKISSVMTRMLRDQLAREQELWRSKPRWRYFRRRGLDGPIAELERAFQNGDMA